MENVSENKGNLHFLPLSRTENVRGDEHLQQMFIASNTVSVESRIEVRNQTRWRPAYIGLKMGSLFDFEGRNEFPQIVDENWVGTYIPRFYGACLQAVNFRS